MCAPLRSGDGRICEMAASVGKLSGMPLAQRCGVGVCSIKGASVIQYAAAVYILYIRPSDGGGGQCGGRLQARLVGGMLESGDGRIVAAVLKEVGVYVYVEASQFLRESCKPRYF